MSSRNIWELTPRERQVLELVSEGKSSKEVASTLGLAWTTIRTYRKTLMKKIGVTNVAGLTRYAVAADRAQEGR